MRLRLLAAVLVLAAHGLVGAEELRPRHLVVFNKPGPQFAAHAQHRDAVLAHRDLYQRLAAEGEILVGGRFLGEPVLGLSVFRRGADADALRALLEADPAVRLGIISLEFREWELQMGGLPDELRRAEG